MAEPTSTTAGVAIAAGAITLTGSIAGVHYDMLLAGFFGGLVSLSFLPQMTRLRVATTVATSSLAAGFFGPSVVVVVLHYFPYLSEIGAGIRICVGAAIGLCFQSVVPAVFNKIRTYGER